MTDAGETIDRLWRLLPEERPRLRPYVERAEAYRKDCGCSMGGAFLVGSFGLVILDGVLFGGFARGSVLTVVLRGAAWVFGATIIGKLVGIGIARFRLTRLYRRLRVEYHVEGV
jgi:hypothetical protein